MKSYISGSFLNHLNLICEKLRTGFPGEELSNLQALKELLLATKINYHVDDPFIFETLEGYRNRKNYNSYAELILINAVKRGLLNPCSYNFEYPKDRNAFYFLSQRLSQIFENHYGVIAKGEGFNGLNYFQNLSVSDLPLSVDYEILNRRVHPCNSMIILDKYIFSNPFKIKINNLIKFIKLFKKSVSDFQLTIVYSQKINDTVITKRSNLDIAIKELRQIKGLQFELLANDSKSLDDRIILTNYSSINIGHPFDNRKTRYNQQFYAYAHTGEAIKENYSNYLITVSEVKLIVDRILENKHSRHANKNFENRIFKAISLWQSETQRLSE